LNHLILIAFDAVEHSKFKAKEIGVAQSLPAFR
jgi:hypothetical protein